MPSGDPVAMFLPQRAQRTQRVAFGYVFLCGLGALCGYCFLRWCATPMGAAIGCVIRTGGVRCAQTTGYRMGSPPGSDGAIDSSFSSEASTPAGRCDLAVGYRLWVRCGGPVGISTCCGCVGRDDPEGMQEGSRRSLRSGAPPEWEDSISRCSRRDHSRMFLPQRTLRPQRVGGAV
ncbi:hypothetical protein EC9_54370 [Rosistilla ulvae]|uniref:Uncharacterized protein n=1 Tax=Rosistilla ulvae TaxID=1930277 RepID=A0A517M8K8_9BACT|nr:hypothetical protein EC9_54370 [Rosistilla ulvae]